MRSETFSSCLTHLGCYAGHCAAIGGDFNEPPSVEITIHAFGFPAIGSEDGAVTEAAQEIR